MINRGKMPRQLRRSGGITNAVPRQGYFLGGLGDFIGDALGKVGRVAKQVVKSPIGKAALLGLGASVIGPKIMSGGLKGLSGKLFGTALPGAVGRDAFMGMAGKTGTSGILGKLGLTKGFGSKMPTMLGAITGGSLLTYFMGKGASEDEAKELARDVYRGEGIGFDQIRADLNKYRSGDLNPQQMFDKNYRFLTPRNFIAAEGGSPNIKMAEIPKGLTMEKAVRTFELSNGRKPKNMQEVIEFFKNRKLSSEGGMPDDYLYKMDKDAKSFTMPTKESEKKRKKGDVKTKKDIFERDTPLTEDLFGLSEGFTLSPITLLRRFLAEKELEKKSKKAKGGIMSMPTGKMRRNSAGVMERDYRDEGGFVPVGVKEKADDVPAMLSKNEFVMTADAVRGAGDGNIKKGAQRMYDLMKKNEGKVA
jgi:hypothetical protein